MASTPAAVAGGSLFGVSLLSSYFGKQHSPLYQQPYHIIFFHDLILGNKTDTFELLNASHFFSYTSSPSSIRLIYLLLSCVSFSSIRDHIRMSDRHSHLVVIAFKKVYCFNHAVGRSLTLSF